MNMTAASVGLSPEATTNYQTNSPEKLDVPKSAAFAADWVVFCLREPAYLG